MGASERDREERERLEYERQQKEKDRILRRIMDGNVRMMGTGFRQAFQWMESEREKERQLMFKQRGLMLNGVGMGDSEMKKIQLIKRLTNQGYNLQVMAANALKEFLASERDREERERLEYERQQKEKDRILRRIMDSNVRMMGL